MVRSGNKKPSKAQSSEKKIEAFIAKILYLVPEFGWTDSAVIEAAKFLKLTSAQVHVLLPDGIKSVVEHFHQSLDAEMQAAIAQDRRFQTRKVREKIAFAVQARLEALTPHREAMRRLLGWYAFPQNLVAGARRMWRTSDLIWVAAGDTSTDYNHYTKRGLLVAVMKATLLFWLQDDSPGYRETWRTLDRHLDSVVRVGRWLSAAKNLDGQDIRDAMSFVRRKFSSATAN